MPAIETKAPLAPGKKLEERYADHMKKVAVAEAKLLAARKAAAKR